MAPMSRLCYWLCITPREKEEPINTIEYNTIQKIKTSRTIDTSRNGSQNSEESESLNAPSSSTKLTRTTTTTSRNNLPMPTMGSNDSNLASSLTDRIWDNLEHGDDFDKAFFPDSCWNRLLKEAEVKELLRKYGENPAPELVNFILKNAAKIFAILIIMGQPKLITAFYNNTLGQGKLPVKPESVGGMLKKAGWEKGWIMDFCRAKQWWCLIPKFTQQKFRYDFEKSYHLPFTKFGKRAGLGGSNYSTVEERSIHVDHVEVQQNQVSRKHRAT